MSTTSTKKNTVPRDSDWFHVSQPLERPRLRLFCFPYAGGFPTAYHPWSSALPADVEMCTLALPGRAFRIAEPAFTLLSDLVSAAGAVLSPFLSQAPFAFYGHSMGALTAYELTRWLRRRGLSQPLHLIVSGRVAPATPPVGVRLSELTEPALQRLLRDSYGMREEVLRNAALMDLVLPPIRADFALLDSWSYEPQEPLSVPITAFGGTEDVSVPRAALEAWRHETTAKFEAHLLAGDHFFINHSQPFVRMLADTLARIAAPSR